MAANIEDVLAEISEAYAESDGNSIPELTNSLDERLEKAMRADALALFERIMSAFGKAESYGTPSGFKEVTVCTTLGYARYSRAYYAPSTGRKTRQMRRADERLKLKAEKRERRKRGGVYPRHGGAPCEYLHAAVTLAEKDAANIAKVYKAAKSILYRFDGASFIKHMRKRYATLDADHEAWEKLGYIDDRCDHMKYGEYRKQGLYIGSGLVDSACRTDVARRCKQSGMHWRFKNAASMCALVARFRSKLPAA